MLEAGTDGTSVVTKGTTSVVAPGTEGFMTLVISGEAEVKSAITVAVADTAEHLTSPLANAKDIYLDSYHPLKWTITNNDAATTVTNGTLSDVETYLEGLTDEEIPANEKINYNLKISWAWDFDDNGAGTNDVLDTRLADLKALSSDKYDEKYGENAYSTDNSKSNLTLSFAMSVKVVQIQ